MSARSARLTPPLAMVLSAALVACSSPSHRAPKTLAIADLPYGWATSPSSTDDSVTAPCSAITSDAGGQPASHAEADFQQSEDGPFLQEILGSGSAQRVQALWASVRNAAGLCAPSTRLSTTPFPSYGDQSYALALTADRSGVAYSGDVVVVRKGQVFVEVVVFGVGGVPASLVQQMVDKSVHKVGS